MKPVQLQKATIVDEELEASQAQQANEHYKKKLAGSLAHGEWVPEFDERLNDLQLFVLDLVPKIDRLNHLVESLQVKSLQQRVPFQQKARGLHRNPRHKKRPRNVTTAPLPCAAFSNRRLNRLEPNASNNADWHQARNTR